MKILYLYYNQPEAIRFFEKLGYPDIGFDFVFIDDGSKQPLICKWADVYRIEKDTPWNQPAANNLGLSVLDPDDYVLRMDIDHWFTKKDLRLISQLELDKREVVHFRRVSIDKRLDPHPNIFLARVSDLTAIGGYNEDYCGSYGYDDLELRRRMEKAGFKFTLSNINCRAEPTLSTRGLKRDTETNRVKFTRDK